MKSDPIFRLSVGRPSRKRSLSGWPTTRRPQITEHQGAECQANTGTASARWRNVSNNFQIPISQSECYSMSKPLDLRAEQASGPSRSDIASMDRRLRFRSEWV
jgi:hypothetical protein